MWIDHSIDRLGKAITAWDTGAGFWEERFKQALVWANMVNQQDLPPEFWPQFIRLSERLNRSGSIQATISGISETEAKDSMSEIQALRTRLLLFKSRI
jgi:hypothetical protein